MNVEPGSFHSVAFPFVLEEVDLPPDEPGAGFNTVKSWRPGVKHEHDGTDGTDAHADAVGSMLLTVIDVHKPGRFPTRVFFTRQWKDPTGKVFGKGSLRITTLDAFRRRAKGYMHEFYLDGELFDVAAALGTKP